MKRHPTMHTTGSFAPPRLMSALPVTLTGDDLALEAMLLEARRRAELKGLPDHAARFARMVALLRRRQFEAQRAEEGAK